MTISKYTCILLCILLLFISTMDNINPVIPPLTASKDIQTQKQKVSPILPENEKSSLPPKVKPVWKKKCKKIVVGSTFIFKVKKTKKSQYIRYRSSNKKVAGIRTKSGKLTAKNIGKTTVSAIIYKKTGKPVKKLKCRLKVISSVNKTENPTDSETLPDKELNKENPTDSSNTLHDSATSDISKLPINTDTSDIPSYSSLPVVTSVSPINNWNFTITLTLDSPALEDDLKNTSIRLQKKTNTASSSYDTSQIFYADYSSVSSDGYLASYMISKKSQKIFLPQDSSMDGTYQINSDFFSLSDSFTTTYKEYLHAGTIQGFILDANQKPLAGATIHVYPSSAVFHSDGTTKTKELFSTKSDENGYYFLKPDNKDISLLVTKENYLSEKKLNISINASYAKCCNFTLTNYKESELSYEIFTYNKNNEPVQNATVSLYDNQDKLLQKCLTDKNGRAVFCNFQGLPFETLDSVHGVRAKKNAAYFNKQDTYHIVVEKNLCENNYSDIYEPYTQYFTFSNRHHCAMTESIFLSDIAALTSIPIQLTWTKDAFTDLNTYHPYLHISLLSDNGELLSAGGLVPVKIAENTLSVSLDLMDYNSLLFPNGRPCLKDGTYYLQIRNYRTIDTSSLTNANTIIPLHVANGKADTCTVVFSTGCNANGKVHFKNISLKEYSALLQSFVLPKLSIYQCLDNGTLAFIESKTGTNLSGTDFLTSSYSFSNLCENERYIVTASFPYSDNITPVSFTAEKEVNTINDFLLTATSSAISSIKFYTQNGDGLSGNNKPVKVEFLRLLDSHKNVLFNYQHYENNTLPIKNSFYAFCEEDGNYSLSIPDSLQEFSNLPEDSYAAEIKLEGYEPIVTNYTYCSPMQTHALTVTSRLTKTPVTTLQGTLLYDSDIPDLPEKPAASIMLYDMQNHIVAGKDIPSKTYRYSLTDGIDGVLENGQYKLVVRGNGIKTYQTFVSIRKDYTNTCNIVCKSEKPSSLSLLLIDSTGNHATFQQAKSSIVIHEKDTPVNVPENWLVSSYYRELTYTETIPLCKTDKASNEWSTDASLSFGSYVLSINADFCNNHTENIFIKKDGQILQKNITLLRKELSSAVEYHFSFKNLQPSHDNSTLAAVCYNSDGNIVEQIIVPTDSAIKNGISLTMLSEKSQKIIFFNEDNFLTYYSVIPDRYSTEVTLDCTAHLNW